MNTNIYVTQPFLPALEEFTPYLKQIWDNKILTNGGPYHQELEQALCEYLGVKHIALFTNGTLALITALQALRVTGEVITTPYSFVATSHSLLWHNCKPVFVDIEPNTLNIDPKKIEAAITPQTTAILPVHCYGNPCNIAEIEKISENYNLRVIYDAAHAFGVKDAGGSILRHGDLSVLSFHATKVFNTFEGGAIVCPDAKTKQRIDHLKNFGFVDETTVVAPGINAKMSEINAAFGLIQIKHMQEILQKRAQIANTYKEQLKDITGIGLIDNQAGITSNHAYFPIMINSEFQINRDTLYENLKNKDIYARRYFYPLISDFPMYRSLPSAARNTLPVAVSAADRVLCLPIYPVLTQQEQERIIDALRTAGS